MKYWVISNGSHVTVVAISLEKKNPAQLATYTDEWAMQQAGIKFEKAELNFAVLKLEKTFDDDIEDSDNIDDVTDLGISEKTLIDVSREIRTDDSVSIDHDAVVSGMNVQSWLYIDPWDVLNFLASEEPQLLQRNTPSREQVLDEEVLMLRRQITQLQQSLDVRNKVINDFLAIDSWENDDIAPKALIDRAKCCIEPVKDDAIVFASDIRDWNWRSDDFPPEHVVDYRLTLTKNGDDQYYLEIKNERENGHQLGLCVEVNHGRPAVHVFVDEGGDPLLHIHSDKNEAIILHGDSDLDRREQYRGEIYSSSIGERISARSS